jgi:choline dehydrogenase-like flavoprotein
VPGFFGMSIAEGWEQRQSLLPRINNTAIYYAMVKASGRGKIRPIYGVRDPLVTYDLKSEDFRDLALGLKYLSVAMLEYGAKKVYPSFNHHAGWTTPAEIDAERVLSRQKKRAQLMTIHLFSSCPMGEDRTQCAVDSFGRLHGFDNVRIADASVIPDAPGVNPQATVMALAYRSAGHWLDRYSSLKS